MSINGVILAKYLLAYLTSQAGLVENLPPYHFLFQHLKDKHLSFSESNLYESYFFSLPIGQEVIWHELILYLAQPISDLCYDTVAGINCPKWLILQPDFTTRGAGYKYLSKQPLIWNLILRHLKWQIDSGTDHWSENGKFILQLQKKHSGKSARRKSTIWLALTFLFSHQVSCSSKSYCESSLH